MARPANEIKHLNKATALTVEAQTAFTKAVGLENNNQHDIALNHYKSASKLLKTAINYIGKVPSRSAQKADSLIALQRRIETHVAKLERHKDAQIPKGTKGSP